MIAAIRAALRIVAEVRGESAAATDALKFKRAQFAEENEALLDYEKLTREALTAAEENARALVLAYFTETENASTTPSPGVQVKLYVVPKYELAVALAWATEKQMALIPAKLDVAAFEKIAKATPLSFVTMEMEPRVTLATKLDPRLLVEPDEVPAA